MSLTSSTVPGTQMFKKHLLNIYCNSLLISLCASVLPPVSIQQPEKSYSSLHGHPGFWPYLLALLTSTTNPCAHFILQPCGLCLFLEFIQLVPDLGALPLGLLFFPQGALPPAAVTAGCFSLRETFLDYPTQPNPTPHQSLYRNILFYCLAKTCFNLVSLLGDYLSPLFRKQHKSRDPLLFTTYPNTQNNTWHRLGI